MTIQEENQQAMLSACTLWRQHGESIPVDIARIARAFEFVFDYRPAPLGFHGVLYDRLKLIVVNACLPSCRQRYVIAHELGHWLVRTRQLRVRAARVERLCQLFAAHLLMPPERVAASARTRYGSADLLAALAAEYLVTPSAMRIQLQQLNLLPGSAIAPANATIAADKSTILLPSDGGTVPIWDVNIDAVYHRQDAK
jgi:Zn-dependent peptidase ImmA (M78 family)